MMYAKRGTKNYGGANSCFRKRWLAALAVILGVAVCAAACASGGSADFAAALRQSVWEYARAETRSDTVAGPEKPSNADFAADYIITLAFQKDGAMVASYAPRTGGDPGIYVYEYAIEDNERALIQNDDYEYNGKTYASFTEYTLNGDGELVSRWLSVDRKSDRSVYFGGASIYTPVGVNAQSEAVTADDQPMEDAAPIAVYGQPEKITTLRNSLNMDAELRLFAGDFNTDGFCDVVAMWFTAYQTNIFKMQFLLNDQKGGLVPGTSEVLGEGEIQSLFIPYPDTLIVCDDLNSDLKNDLFIAISKDDNNGFSGWQNALYLSDGDGILYDTTASLPQRTDSVHSIASTDIDNDGDIDIYVGVMWSSDDVDPYLLINNGKGKFSVGKDRLPPQLRLTQNGYTASAFADVNNDSFPDLILGDFEDMINNEYSSRDSLVLLNDKHGKFKLKRNALPEKPSDKSLVLSIVPTDLNADGWTDLIFVYTNDYIGMLFRAYINNQDGTFHDESQRLPGASKVLGPACYRLLEMDADHDGDMDLLAKIWDENAPQPMLLINDGNGYFTSVDFPVEINTLYYTFLDVDNDGGNDVIYGDYGNITDIFLMRDLTN